MSGALVRQQGSLDLMGEGFERVERMATGLAKSGMFKDTNAGQALAKILIGADMGLTPTQALMTIDLVRGNVQIRGKRLLAWVRQSENYDYAVMERSPERGTIRFFEKSTPEARRGRRTSSSRTTPRPVEIASGEGDGTLAPGWEGLSDEQVAEIEALIEVEHKLGPGSLDLATVQMMLNGRPEAVEAWLADTRDVLAKRKTAEDES
jgi:hypothetical protein